MRGAAGDGVEATVVAGAQLQGDLGEVDLSGLMFLERTPPNNSDESAMYIALTQQQLRNVVDVNGRLYIALTDADDHGRSMIQKLVSGVRTPKLHKSLQP